MKPADPNERRLDAAADGAFQSARAGYGSEADRLARVLKAAHAGHSLAAGEGLLLARYYERLLDNLLRVSAQLAPPDFEADVRAFHAKVAPAGLEATRPGFRRTALRLRLIQEECDELTNACGFPTDGEALEAEESDEGMPDHEPDFPAAVDALVDLLYVTFGALIEWGVPIPAAWAEVQRTNMAKEGGPSRPDGKVLKPAGWTPPDIAGVLTAAGWDGSHDDATVADENARLATERRGEAPAAGGAACPRDTNGDGDCGRPLCPDCGVLP